METAILAGIAVVVSILICMIHFKRTNYATLVFNILIIIGVLYIFGKTLGGLIVAAVSSVSISLILLLWSPLKGLDKEFKGE